MVGEQLWYQLYDEDTVAAAATDLSQRIAHDPRTAAPSLALSSRPPPPQPQATEESTLTDDTPPRPRRSSRDAPPPGPRPTSAAMS